MRIVEFSAGTLRFLDQLPASAPAAGFVWVYLDRESLAQNVEQLQQAALNLGGSTLLELHLQDLANDAHPSHYDFTSIYDLVIFQRLATDFELRAEAPKDEPVRSALAAFARIRARAVGFVVFDRLLITVHPQGCFAANTFIRRFLADAAQSEGQSAAVRSRLPTGSADLMLRMLNMMVDSYLELRKDLSSELDHWQQQLLAPHARRADLHALMSARTALHMLQDLCEGQSDAMQEWLDTQQEQPASWMSQAERDGLMSRARDVVEHIERVAHHVHRMEQTSDTAVQIHFSALSQRTNESMRVLTALTAVFLPLNFMTGFFGMNFEFLPLIHSDGAMWVVLGVMVLVGAGVGTLFWRKRYLARSGR